MIPRLICRYCSGKRVLAAAQIVYDVNNPRPSLKTRRHIRDKAPSRSSPPAARADVSLLRGKLLETWSVALMVGGSRWEEERQVDSLIDGELLWYDRIDVMFTESEEM